jgi:hypothetical protein
MRVLPKTDPPKAKPSSARPGYPTRPSGKGWDSDAPPDGAVWRKRGRKLEEEFPRLERALAALARCVADAGIELPPEVVAYMHDVERMSAPPPPGLNVADQIAGGRILTNEMLDQEGC